jgi:hypothetical protein
MFNHPTRLQYHRRYCWNIIHKYNWKLSIFLIVSEISWLQLFITYMYLAGTDPGFQVRGAHLNKLRRAEGGAKIFGVFRVKNHDFTPKNHVFQLPREARTFLRYFVWKITILRQKNHIFFPILGGARAGCAPPLNPPLLSSNKGIFVWPIWPEVNCPYFHTPGK